MTNIGVLVGSLRQESISKKIGLHLKTLFPEAYKVELLEIGQLPLYNQDYDNEESTLPEYTAFREKLKEMDAFLFVTPEYNRSLPAALKNALDVGSRPKADNVWNQKPAGIISQSPGRLGGFGANHHLRQTLTVLNMPIVQQPEMYISESHRLFNEKGEMVDQRMNDSFSKFIDTFIKLQKKHSSNE